MIKNSSNRSPILLKRAIPPIIPAIPDNAVIKIYDFPVFYYPKFSHPDPSVKRRSGFMVPTFTSNKTVGPGLTQPYFWAISGDKDLTFAPKIHTSENPLMLAEYRQAFEKSLLQAFLI